MEQEKLQLQTEIPDNELAMDEVIEGRKKIDLVPGKRYKGSFWLNEYGVIEVRAAQEGSNPTGLRHVTGGDCYNLYESKNKIRIVLSFMKCDHDSFIKLLRSTVARLMSDLYNYKFL